VSCECLFAVSWSRVGGPCPLGCDKGTFRNLRGRALKPTYGAPKAQLTGESKADLEHLRRRY
jgi:hypothetical protein